MEQFSNRIFSFIWYWAYLIREYFQIRLCLYWRRTGTSLRVSLSKLDVVCWDHDNCLTIFNEKQGILEHPETDLDDKQPVINVLEDPLYTGIQIPRNWIDFFYPKSDGILCNEPPPAGYGGRAGVTDLSVAAARVTNDRPKSCAFTLNLNNIGFYKLEDYNPDDDSSQFLGVSLFRGDYRSLYAQYATIDAENEKMNEAHNCANGDKNDDDNCLSRIIDHPIDSCPFLQSFTVDTYLGHFVTIVKTRYSDRVLRFAYRDKGYFEQQVQFVL